MEFNSPESILILFPAEAWYEQAAVFNLFCFYRKFYSTYIFQQKGNIQE